MKRVSVYGLLVCLLAGAAVGVSAQNAATARIAAPERTAQDTVITNVKIVVGSGPVIDNGHIIIRSGKIAAVAQGAPASTQGLRVIDGQGMTAMPGFIDGHKHVQNSPALAAQGPSLLEAGFTTVLNGGGNAMNNLAIQNRIESGEVNGPRIIASASVPLNQTPQEAAAAVEAMASQGVKHTGEIGLTPEPAPPQAQIEVLRAIVNAAQKVGVQVNVHAVSSTAMVAAIDAGVRRLVHLPNKDFTSFEQAARVGETDSIVSGLIAFGAPYLDRESPPPPGCPMPCPGSVIWPRDNSPRFRNGQPWPESLAGANRDAMGRATGTEAGYTIVNARRIWDASNGRGISYSTDQNAADLVVLEHELKSFSIVFSNPDLHKILTSNSSRFVGLENEIGTLEVGKRADIVLIQGDVMDHIYQLIGTVKTVFKDGRVVVDKR